MEEQEVLSTLRAHVASYQSPSPNESGTKASIDPLVVEELSAIDPPVVEELSAEVWNASNAVGQLNPRNPGLLNHLIQFFKKVLQRSLGWYTRSLQAFHHNVAQAIQRHGQAIQLNGQAIQRHGQAIQLNGQAIQLQGQAINSIQRQLLDLQTGIPLDEAFESARLATQEQQSPYVQLFHGLSPVVDLGCGRGEFLELLRATGIESYGVDSSPSACEAARRQRLTIVQADLFQHLTQLPERSLGGVFTARLIEYLPPHLQSTFVALCSSKLKPGGRIVIETINPDSDSPFGRNWRLDPSHLHPIYPEILRSLLESNGFHDSQICILAPHVVSVANNGEAGVHSGNGRGGEIPLQPTVTNAPAYAAIGTRA